MNECDIMSNKASTCPYIDRRIMESAKEAELNVSKVAENALVEAIGKLTGTKQGTAFKS